MQLTEHFSVLEMTRTNHRNIDNTPNQAIIDNLHRVAVVMERVRALLNAPIAIGSGYRSPELNSAIGGSKASAHMKGLACDFNAFGLTAKQAALRIAPLVKEFGIDQLIYEGTWVHIGLAEFPRNQILTAEFSNGKTTYQQGIQ